jgi:hypothetical protein
MEHRRTMILLLSACTMTTFLCAAIDAVPVQSGSLASDVESTSVDNADLCPLYSELLERMGIYTEWVDEVWEEAEEALERGRYSLSLMKSMQARSFKRELLHIMAEILGLFGLVSAKDAEPAVPDEIADPLLQAAEVLNRAVNEYTHAASLHSIVCMALMRDDTDVAEHWLEWAVRSFERAERWEEKAWRWLDQVKARICEAQTALI